MDLARPRSTAIQPNSSVKAAAAEVKSISGARAMVEFQLPETALLCVTV
jgi:hypothetical protein